MARRPLTTFDADGISSACCASTLPSFENGLAQKLDLPGGKTGVRLTYTLQPEARWGDGVPVTTDDVIFSYEVGKEPEDRRRRRRALSPHPAHHGQGRQDLHHRCRQADLRLCRAERFRDPARASRARRLRRPRAVPLPHALRHRSDQSRPLFRALPHHRGRARLAHRARAQSRPGGARRPISAASWSGRSRTRRRSKPISWRAASTWWRASSASRSTRRSPSRSAMAASSACSTSPASPTSMSISTSTIRSSPTGACARRCSTASTARRSATSCSPGAIRSPTASCRRSTGSIPTTCRIIRYDPAKARALLDAAGWRQDGRPGAPQRQGARAVARARHHRGQPHPRAGRGGAAEPVARRSASTSASRTSRRACCSATPPTQRNFEMAMFAWISAPENVPRSMLCSDEIPTAANGWSRRELRRLPRPGGRPPHRRDRGRARPRQARRNCGTGSSALCRASCRRCRSISAPRPSCCRSGSTA